MCSEPSRLYLIEWRLTEQFWPHARFLITSGNHTLFAEFTRGTPQFSRLFCTAESSISIQNLDHSGGYITVTTSDVVLFRQAFSPSNPLLTLQVLSLSSYSERSSVDEESHRPVVYREYSITRNEEVARGGLLDLVVQHAQVLSVVLNGLVLFTHTQYALMDTQNGLRLQTEIDLAEGRRNYGMGAQTRKGRRGGKGGEEEEEENEIDEMRMMMLKKKKKKKTEDSKLRLVICYKKTSDVMVHAVIHSSRCNERQLTLIEIFVIDASFPIPTSTIIMFTSLRSS